MSSLSRSSNFELMRLCCMFGIISMHSCASFFNNPSIGILLELDAINTIFNTGVSLFILISGYFGIRTSAKKIFSFWIRVLFCSILSCIIVALINGSVSLRTIVTSLMPIVSNKYWFATSYLVLMLFAPILNKAAVSLSQTSLKTVIIYCLIFFSIIPTFCFFTIPGSGKGILHFIMMYMMGRYIALHMHDVKATKKTLVLLSLVLLIIFALNYISSALYYVCFDVQKVIFPMSRDCSFFIIVASLLIFVLFKSCVINSTLLNKIASHVFCMYLMEGSLRCFLNMYIRLEDYKNVFSFPLALTCYVFIVMLLCLIIGILQEFICSRLSNWIWPISDYLRSMINRYLSQRGNQPKI